MTRDVDRTIIEERAAAPSRAGVVGERPSIGNAALTRTLDELGIRRRAIIGPVDDPAERHADLLAEQAMAALGVTAPAPRPAAVGVADDELGGSDVGPDVAGALAGRSGGTPLDPATRSAFEGAFGLDLGQVRLHTDAEAGTLSEAVGAEAFTHGNDIYFGAGRFQPGTAAGQHLLAHELAHVAQEAGSFTGGRVHRKSSAVLVRRWPWGKKRRKRKQEREFERGGRAALADKVAGGDQKNDATGFNDLQQRFTEQLEYEKDKVAEYVKAGDDKEEAEEKAYFDAWEDDAVDPDLRKLAPMRKTRSEKHARKVDQLFGDMAARSMYDDSLGATAKKGTIVHKPIAKLIDKIEKRSAEMVDELVARKTAYENDAAGTDDYAIDPAEKQRYYDTKARPVAEREVLADDADKWVKKYKELPDAVKKEAHERSRARIAAQKLIEQNKTKETLSLEGVEDAHSDAEEKIGYVKIGDKVQGGGAKATTKILGQVNKQAGRDTLAKANKGKLTVTSSTTFSPEEQAHGMLSGISSGLSSVVSMVSGVQAFIKHIQVAAADGSAQKDPGAMIAIIKEGLAELQKPFKAAKSGMEAAKSFSGAAWTKVASHIPVMDIVTSSLAIVSDIVDLAGSIMQWASNRTGILAARKDGRSELIDAIKRLKMRSATFIGKAVKHLVDNAMSLGSTIATIVTGGLAAPVKGALKAVGMISTYGEKVFDLAQNEMIARKTKAARGHYTEKLSTSAEERFRNDAKVSVAGLIVAATGQDDAAKTIARDVLGQYGSFDFDQENFDPRLVLDQVLNRMGDEADPLAAKDKLEATLKKVKHTRRGLLDTYQDAQNVRSARNAVEVGGKKNRGAFYVLREVLRNVGDRRRIERKMEQTQLGYGMQMEGTREKRLRERADADRADMATHSFGRPSMAAIGGKLHDLNDPSAHAAILDAVEKADPKEVRAEVARLRKLNARNPPMLDLLDKMLEASMSTVSVGA